MKLTDITKVNQNDYLNYINEWNEQNEEIYPLKSDLKNLNFSHYKEMIIANNSSDLFFLQAENGYILGAIEIKYDLDEKDPTSSHIIFGIRPLERNKNLCFIMIKLALNKLRENRIKQAIIVIDRENKAARNTIKKVSGKLVSSEIINSKVIERYEIEL